MSECCPNCGEPGCDSECLLIGTGQPGRDRLRALRDKVLPPGTWSDRRKFLMQAGATLGTGLLIFALNVKYNAPALPMQVASEPVPPVQIRASDTVTVGVQESKAVIVATAATTNSNATPSNCNTCSPYFQVPTEAHPNS